MSGESIRFPNGRASHQTSGRGHDGSGGARILNPETLPKPAGYGHVVGAPKTGRLIHIAGRAGLGRNGVLLGECEFGGQAQQASENVKPARADFSHVVKINMFVLDMSHLLDPQEIRDRSVDTTAPPAGTSIQVSRVFRDGPLFEIGATAIVPA